MQCNVTVKDGYRGLNTWVVEWGLADDFDKVKIVCYNQTHPT
jgi:hypothetical protein